MAQKFVTPVLLSFSLGYIYLAASTAIVARDASSEVGKQAERNSNLICVDENETTEARRMGHVMVRSHTLKNAEEFQNTALCSGIGGFFGIAALVSWFAL